MPVVACLHHLDQPFLGLAEGPLRDAGLTLDERSGSLPDLAAVDGVITFGGAQSAVTPSALLTAEIAFLREAVERGVPVLGICLGGQLLAAAPGAAVTRARRRAIAWRPLSVLDPADPLFGRFAGEEVPALHWNEDVFALPDGAVSLLGPCVEGIEAFRYGPCAWGVQFHPEVDGAALDGWYGSYGPWLQEAGISEPAARALDAEWLPRQAAVSSRLFAAFASVVTAEVMVEARARR